MVWLARRDQASISSSGRGRLPTWLVRIRSLLPLISDPPFCSPACGAFFAKVARGAGNPEMSMGTCPARGNAFDFVVDRVPAAKVSVSRASLATALLSARDHLRRMDG